MRIPQIHILRKLSFYFLSFSHVLRVLKIYLTFCLNRQHIALCKELYLAASYLQPELML